MTHRIDPFFRTTLRIELFQIWLQEMNLLFFKYDSKIFFAKKKLKELNFFNISQRTDFPMTQRINFFYDAKNWTFCLTQRIEPFFFWNMTQRIEPFLSFTPTFEPCIDFDSKNWTFLKYDSKNWTSFWVWCKDLNLFFEYDSKNRTLFWVWFKESNSFLNTTQWIEAIFFECDSKNLNFWLKKSQKIKLSFQKTQNWCVFQMTGRIEPAFFNMTQRIEPFSLNLTQRNEHLFHLTQRFEPCVKKKKRLKEWNSF